MCNCPPLENQDLHGKSQHFRFSDLFKMFANFDSLGVNSNFNRIFVSSEKICKFNERSCFFPVNIHVPVYT